ncbi:MULTISPECIES: DUF4097 family beta strand repeat-containing protein [Oceanobacillus]|uniref:DUF4097 family beta strand repeat-containing protein n=1 Tax=Oceanobacillus TaxID=182709 RepID=UPI00069AE2AB|nr:DUF4097 family beta strand repeat-containing protein [Oceanobacillus caeni]PZD83831.1 hypothetical protein DEJ60_16290 [Bacilli bacterium]MED4475243.1 DUF4097 family beta strand repeat-containing protein [Oceanobacillus caeni]PZD85621.1 hypothetical protein DEJ66_16690 [Bacilli bacterium]RCO04590.1 hypothetical protein DTX80_16105 [Bacilli bacterium]RCO10485.1 hypothetical protein DTX79_04165 [Bacilli bacterium]
MKKVTVIAIVLIGVMAVSITQFFSRNGSGPEQLEVSENFVGVHVKAHNAAVEIFPSDSKSAEIAVSGKNKHDKLEAKVKNDTLMVELKDKRFFSWFTFDWFNTFKTSTLTLYLPRNMYEMIKAETDNGLVKLENINANDIYVETDNGKIDLRNIESSYLSAETDNGTIDLDHVVGEISGTTDNGKIIFNTDTLDQMINLETDNGAIKVYTENDPTNTTFNINTDNGKISVFGNSNYDTVIGDGENLVKLKTDNGSITVEKR